LRRSKKIFEIEPVVREEGARACGLGVGRTRLAWYRLWFRRLFFLRPIENDEEPFGLAIGQASVLPVTKQPLGHLLQKFCFTGIWDASEQSGRNALFQTVMIMSDDHWRSL